MIFAVTKSILDSRIEYYFGKLLKNRKKCEFLAHFPEEGAVQKDLIEAKVFGDVNQNVVNHHVSNYSSFLNIYGKQGSFKNLVLNEDGKDLQQMARYMILMNEEINQEYGSEIDYLDIFPVRAKPRKTLETLKKIYSNGAMTMDELFGKEWCTTSLKMIRRLESLKLVKTDIVALNRQQRYVYKTKQGYAVYHKLLAKVFDCITATCEKSNSELYKYMQNNCWEDYVQKNGNGWAGRLKKS